MIKIRFSIWRDQASNFTSFVEKLDSGNQEIRESVIVDRAEGASYRGWLDFYVTGFMDDVCKFFWLLGDNGYRLHVFKDNPVK